MSGSKKSTLTLIMEWEGENPTIEEYLTLFGRLIKNGQAWTLQGMYGREAAMLIDNGLIDKKGNVLWKEAEKKNIDIKSRLRGE